MRPSQARTSQIRKGAAFLHHKSWDDFCLRPDGGIRKGRRRSPKFAVVSIWNNMVEQDHRRVKNRMGPTDSSASSTHDGCYS